MCLFCPIHPTNQNIHVYTHPSVDGFSFHNLGVDGVGNGEGDNLMSGVHQLAVCISDIAIIMFFVYFCFFKIDNALKTLSHFFVVIIHLPLAHFPPTFLTHLPPVDEPFTPYV